MKTSVIIPTLNEIDTIGELLDNIPKDKVDEILVVDGHSTDGTPELVRNRGYSLLFQQKKGFGSAIAEAVAAAQGDILVFITADNSQNPKDIPNLLEKINEGYDVAMASRYITGGGSKDDTLLHYIGNKLLTFLCNLIHGSHFSDCLYFFFAARRKVFDSVKAVSPGFEYCVELPIKIHQAGLKIIEIPSFEHKRSGGQAKVSAFSDGWKIFQMILKLKYSNNK